jgi:hypothetical protein
LAYKHQKKKEKEKKEEAFCKKNKTINNENTKLKRTKYLLNK